MEKMSFELYIFLVFDQGKRNNFIFQLDILIFVSDIMFYYSIFVYAEVREYGTFDS
jgi:hypothetical protein